jgi:D-cysteine desulfhydrase
VSAAPQRPWLYQRFPGLRAGLPHAALGHGGATPVGPLDLGDSVEAELWVKDDGAFAPLMGGNKPRKLEWVLADALRRGRRSILTVGALGTNHGLATALFARESGLRAILALVDQPLDDHIRAQFERILESGASVHLTHNTLRTTLTLPWLMARHADLLRMRLPYYLGVGGSSPVGCVGFVEAALELAWQVEAGLLPEPEHVVLAAGSGGSSAGLALGLRLAGLRSRVVAVQVNDRSPLDPRRIARLARRTEALLRHRGASFQTIAVNERDFGFERGFLGAGYGHRTARADAASALARGHAGLELEPVYTAKAMAGLIGLAGRGALGRGPVLYWHTCDSGVSRSAG